MPAATNSITVRILQRDFTLACSEAEAPGIQAAADYLDRQMRALATGATVPGAERVAIMAALNISHELLTLRNSTQTDAAHDARLQKLQQQIDQAVAAMQQSAQQKIT